MITTLAEDTASKNPDRAARLTSSHNGSAKQRKIQSGPGPGPERRPGKPAVRDQHLFVYNRVADYV